MVGSGFSSLDISREVSPFVKHIYRSVRAGDDRSFGAKQFRSVAQFLDPENLTEVTEIERFGPVNRALRARETQIFLKDGTVLEGIDRVIFCTGYLYTMPFLRFPQQDPPPPSDRGANIGEEAIVTDAMQVHNLHKDLFYIHDPTLAFIGISHGIATFPFFDTQAMAVAAVFTGNVALPTVAEMRLEYEDRMEKLGSGRAFHGLGPRSERMYVEEMEVWMDGASKGGTGHDESWYQTRSVGPERFLQNRMASAGFDTRDIEASVREQRRVAERLEEEERVHK